MQKYTENIGQVFSLEKVLCPIRPKMGFGYILGDFFWKLIWDRCYDFKKNFAEKNCEKIGVFDSNQS
jgi:hypothetical protein